MYVGGSGGGSAFTFRVRNLLFHLICAICVYGLALILTREHTTALVSGLLFCLDPVANQTVVAAIFTNTIAYACLLVGLLTFLIWSESKRTIFLAFSLLLVLCGMFYYEPVIVVFPMMIGYLCLQKYRNSVAPTLKEMVAWIGGSTAVLLAYALTRHLFVRGESFRVPFLTMLHNTILYAGGLLSPIDVVTANKFFRLPLPPVTHLGEKILALLVITIAVLSVGSIAFLKTPKAQAGMQRLDKGLIAYLIFSIPIALSPFLLFTPHASETYLYLPCALYSILLSVLLWAFLPTKTAYRLTVAMFLLSFGTGTWIRNQRVTKCGNVAKDILKSLPVSHWKYGDQLIRLSSGQSLPPHYGIYNYEGLATIDPNDPTVEHGAQDALQMVTGNSKLKVIIVSPSEMSRSCGIPNTCFEVSRDGNTRPVFPAP